MGFNTEAIMAAKAPEIKAHTNCLRAKSIKGKESAKMPQPFPKKEKPAHNQDGRTCVAWLIYKNNSVSLPLRSNAAHKVNGINGSAQARVRYMGNGNYEGIVSDCNCLATADKTSST